MAISADTIVLTINSGSSSIKPALFRIGSSPAMLCSGVLNRIGLNDASFIMKDARGAVLIDQPTGLPNHVVAMKTFFGWLDRYASLADIDAVGHRIVHGGREYSSPALVCDALLENLQRLVPLAPEHMPHEIDAVRSIRSLHPEMTQVACFDTAFHAQMPNVARICPLPRNLANDEIQRYGFHGLSCEYIVHNLRRIAPEEAELRLVIAHMGNGVSITAVKNGRSIDTTMGFTPCGGLPMSTRAGDLDPGIILYLIQQKNLSAAEVHEIVNRHSGLLGVSALSSDMKDLLESENDNVYAAEAIELFCYRARQAVAAMAAAMDGVDSVIFTGGIGENAASIRRRICSGLGMLGIRIDDGRNYAAEPLISADTSRVKVRVMKTNEELMIARHTHNMLCLQKGDPR